MDYHGFVEGDDIGKGTVDVVVTEGFAGNIALKTAEGTARQIAQYLRAAMSRTLMARIGYLFARTRLRRSCARRWICARSMAAYSSGSTAWSSRAMAAPTRKDSRRPSKWVTTWFEQHHRQDKERLTFFGGRRSRKLKTGRPAAGHEIDMWEDQSDTYPLSTGCGSYLPAPRHEEYRLRGRSSRPTTSGSSSEPASASATSSPRAKPQPDLGEACGARGDGRCRREAEPTST